jgi:hypothetical protein
VSIGHPDDPLENARFSRGVMNGFPQRPASDQNTAHSRVTTRDGRQGGNEAPGRLLRHQPTDKADRDIVGGDAKLAADRGTVVQPHLRDAVRDHMRLLRRNALPDDMVQLVLGDGDNRFAGRPRQSDLDSPVELPDCRMQGRVHRAHRMRRVDLRSARAECGKPGEHARLRRCA